MRVGALADRTGTTIRALGYDESLGLVVPHRRPARPPTGCRAAEPGAAPAALTHRDPAHRDAPGYLAVEDLGTGMALEDLLVAGGAHAATRGFVALAEAVDRRVESAYRGSLTATHPGLLDDRTYAEGAAAATAAWAVVRLVRLPKLFAADQPHPMGISRRGQMIDTIQVAVDAARASGTLSALPTLVRGDHRGAAPPLARAAARPAALPRPTIHCRLTIAPAMNRSDTESV